MPEIDFSCPFGQFQLRRYPEPRGRGQQQSLRAWDAADSYLLNYLCEQSLLTPVSKVAVLNDSFGALSVSLHEFQPLNISDSFLAQEACRRNMQANGLAGVEYLDSLTLAQDQFDLVLIKVPKTLALLEDQLYRLRESIRPDTVIVAAAMAKHIHTSTLKLFEKILGPTRTSLAVKKARLIFCTADADIWQGSSPYPSSYVLENTALKIFNHANVFSRQGLDIGTRLFLKNLPEVFSGKDIVDLGCGNGLVALSMALRNPAARFHCVDESYMALASAQRNFELNAPSAKVTFTATNCLEGVESETADLILNNPPFHQQNVVGDFIAWQMFVDAKRVLKSGGELWVVGNRHLGYHVKLKKLFGNCEIVDSDHKFVILKSVKNHAD